MEHILYDRDLFDTITCTLAEVSSTHLKSLGYNVKEGDIVRVKVIHSWTGPEDHLPMVATFKDEETPQDAGFAGVNESEVSNLLSSGKAGEALKLLLSSAPIGSKNQADKVCFSSKKV